VPGIAGAILYGADIEPDADHDDYCDVTQDASPASLRVSKTGRFSYSFTATPLSLGTVSLKGTKKVKIGSKKRFMAIAAKSFTPTSAGEVKVKLKLSSKNLKAVKKARKMRFVVIVTLGGKTFTINLALKAPKT